MIHRFRIIGMTLLLALAAAIVYGQSQSQKQVTAPTVSRQNSLKSMHKVITTYYATDLSQSVRLAYPTEEGCLDIAYSPEKREVFVLLCHWKAKTYFGHGPPVQGRQAIGCHIQKWSETGTLLQDWK